MIGLSGTSVDTFALKMEAIEYLVPKWSLINSERGNALEVWGSKDTFPNDGASLSSSQAVYKHFKGKPVERTINCTIHDSQ